MAVFALLSAGGSPGVTTAALALSLSWPAQVIIAECDPSGGDILAGLLSGHLPAAAGLLPLALEAGAGAEVPADTLWRQLVELDEEHSRLLLAGISDPRQSAALQSSLPWIAEALQGLRADVLADCGRLDALAAVRPVLSAATLAVLILQPTLRQVSRAIPRVEMLVNLMGPGRVVLLPVGAGAASSRELGQTLGVPVVGQLPRDPKTAAVLSDGLGRRRRLDERPLIRSAAAVGRGIRSAAVSAGPLPGFGGPPVYTPYAAGQPDLEGYAPDQSGLGGYRPGQPGAARPAPGSAVPGRAPSRPGGYGPAPSRPASDPAAPASDPVPYAASPPAPDDRDGRAGNPGQPYQPGHSRDPGPRSDQHQRPTADPVTSGEPPWGLRSATPGPSSASYGSRWPDPDRHDPDQYGADQYGADQYRVFGVGPYRAGPPEPRDAAAEPDGPRPGPAQNGSRS